MTIPLILSCSWKNCMHGSGVLTQVSQNNYHRPLECLVSSQRTPMRKSAQPAASHTHERGFSFFSRYNAPK
eukprot:CAMPEP_0177543766 /NCGR_PEP_ID=MMETSP0369-20130122/61604_1 /TAXON_ID=447022 ORGANISM="Scrippsiella hangoei-like, Strain SHHI-4" /NCGR_SAMPLE_ID=MMETSP0369 /ASSEMBLY_ACC=CAM_ASM_000364 /LENGTH=70 /DNA_ID=CAMNT_0019027703 /DNA_START=17 /DNA_END=226 /DNA_ORIENTATION=-